MASKITGIITSAKRMTSSQNGNPRWQVTIVDDDREFLLSTQGDSSIGYDIDNLRRSGARRTFHLSRNGRITHDTDPED